MYAIGASTGLRCRWAQMRSVVRLSATLPGETVGSRRPWPAWTHSDLALVQVAGWLRRFHEAVLDFDPGAVAVWREGVSGVRDW